MLTYETGARILALHHVAARPSQTAGRIDAQAESVARDGTILREWEAVELTTAALRDWLGY